MRLSPYRLLTALILVLGLLTSERTTGAETSFRTWTSQADTTVEARMIESRGEMVTLEMRDGRRIEVNVADLSSDDQRFLAEKVATASPQPASSRNLRAQLDVWKVPEIRLRTATFPEAAAELAGSVNAAYPDAGLRIRIDDALAGNDAGFTLVMQQVKLSEALFTFATIARAGWAVIGNEVVFVARDDPRAEARPVRSAQPEAQPDARVPRLFRFKVEVLSVSARQEREILDMLPRQQPGQRHVFDSRSDEMQAALRHISRQSGIRTVQTFHIETPHSVNVHDRKKSGRVEVSVQCTPQISPEGIVNALVSCGIFDSDEGQKSYSGSCVFTDESLQVILTRHVGQAEVAARWRNRYVVRVAYEPVQ